MLATAAGTEDQPPAGAEDQPPAGAEDQPPAGTEDRPSVAARESGPAAGGAVLLDAAIAARRVVVGQVESPQRVDAEGFVATLSVERSLRGRSEPGARLRIGWEERSRARPPRFGPGDRVLVALARPTGSLWRERFGGGDAFVVAADGSAFLREPQEETLHQLARVLVLEDEAPGTPDAIEALAALVPGASAALGHAALSRLGRSDDLDERLTPASLRALSLTCEDATRDAVRCQAVLDLVAHRELASLRPLAVAEAALGGASELAALRALAALDGGLGGSRVAALLERPEPDLRELAVRQARGTPSESRVAELARGDPAPAVRAAAVESWIAWRGIAGLAVAESACADSDPGVRGAAARSAGALGAPAVPPLEVRAMQASGAEAIAFVGALAMAGPEGQAALERLESAHPDPATRRAIGLALGRSTPAH